MNPGDADWIAPAVLKAFGLTDDEPYTSSEDQNTARFVLERCAGSWKQINGDRDALIVELLDDIERRTSSHFGDVEATERGLRAQRLRDFVDICRGHGVDVASYFTRSFGGQTALGQRIDFWMLSRFATMGAVTASDMVSREQALMFGDESDWWGTQAGYGNRQDHIKEPTSLLMWMVIEGPRAAEHLVEGMSDLDTSAFVRLARAIAYALGILPRLERFFGSKRDLGRDEDFAGTCRRVFEEAHKRVTSCEAAPEDLRYVWLRYAVMAAAGGVGCVSDEARARLIRAAADDIGRLRPLLRRATKEDADQIRSSEPYFGSCVSVLFKFGSLWQAIKPLLLAFRATQTRAVGFDLRYWPTGQQDDPPVPWEMIPRYLMLSLQSYMGREQERDQKLDGLRVEFASFCLERLKSRKLRSGEAKPELVEEDPAWREGFIQATRALYVNPKGKGHHVLNWAQDHDPDENVRELAANAYAELRHQPSLPKGYSPRRAVFDAFWWLRQAHLISLGLGDSIDLDGASRIREEEARRTTEPTQK